ncbi:hypothetical protein DFJ58DRAFT_845606 [Suillus subalutaceus]|uniref:uncharacterized protein n=1 Tax=Suillus subalutaceus TaxID=48586 RepID=UPI001B876458|nr:uncharacterized protein DFJ58DRAFT_845606 [Suillus subalutaceus]KAG1839752.1 hypothetical protein DFJ58DRAFT_845606 [Suillus subalutaceus]
MVQIWLQAALSPEDDVRVIHDLSWLECRPERPDRRHQWMYVSLVPSYAPAEDCDDIVFYEDERGYAKVANTIADDCHIYFYCGTLYNIPADANAPPPFTCVTSGHYIGVFSAEDYVPMVKGITDAVFFKVESLEVGERALRKAIERSDIVRFLTPL